MHIILYHRICVSISSVKRQVAYPQFLAQQNECKEGPLLVTLAGVGALFLAWKNCLGIEGTVYMRDKSSRILMGSCPCQRGKRHRAWQKTPTVC